MIVGSFASRKLDIKNVLSLKPKMIFQEFIHDLQCNDYSHHLDKVWATFYSCRVFTA